MLRASTLQHDPRAQRVALAVQQVPGVEQVLLFGSRARGDHRPDSDIDILLTHPRNRDIRVSCRDAVNQAARIEYDAPISVDLVHLTPEHFEFMQHGLNHVAAHAARDGITPMGYRYLRPPNPSGSIPSEQSRRESMERATHARRCLTSLINTFNLGDVAYVDPQDWEIALGEQAQGTLEHGLKALIAAYGKTYDRTHKLNDLWNKAHEISPDLGGLKSDLHNLSAFAGGYIYESPDLNQDAAQVLEQVRNDMDVVFQLCQKQAGYDPWTVTVSDFKRST